MAGKAPFVVTGDNPVPGTQYFAIEPDGEIAMNSLTVPELHVDKTTLPEITFADDAGNASSVVMQATGDVQHTTADKRVVFNESDVVVKRTPGGEPSIALTDGAVTFELSTDPLGHVNMNANASSVHVNGSSGMTVESVAHAAVPVLQLTDGANNLDFLVSVAGPTISPSLVTQPLTVSEAENLVISKTGGDHMPGIVLTDGANAISQKNVGGNLQFHTDSKEFQITNSDLVVGGWGSFEKSANQQLTLKQSNVNVVDFAVSNTGNLTIDPSGTVVDVASSLTATSDSVTPQFAVRYDQARKATFAVDVGDVLTVAGATGGVNISETPLTITKTAGQPTINLTDGTNTTFARLEAGVLAIDTGNKGISVKNSDVEIRGTSTLLSTNSPQLVIRHSVGKETTMAVDNNGDLSIDASGNDLNLSSTDTVHVLNATDNTLGAADGALQVTGGAYVAKNFTVAGTCRTGKIETRSVAPQIVLGVDLTNYTLLATSASGDCTIDASGNDLNLSSTDTVRVLNATDNTLGVADGALQVTGGAYLAKNVTVAGSVRAGAIENRSVGPQAVLSVDALTKTELTTTGLGNFTITPTGPSITLNGFLTTGTSYNDINVFSSVKSGPSAPLFVKVGATEIYGWEMTAAATKDLTFNVQLPHDVKPNTAPELHIHVMFVGAPTGGQKTVLNTSFTHMHVDGTANSVSNSRLEVASGSFATETHKLISVYTFANSYTTAPSAIIGGTIQRLGADAQDTDTRAMYVIGMDVHAAIDRLGSATL